MSTNFSSFDNDVDFVVAKHGNTKMAGWQKVAYALLIVMLLLCIGTIVNQQREINEKQATIDGQVKEIDKLKSEKCTAKSEVEDLKKKSQQHVKNPGGNH